MNKYAYFIYMIFLLPYFLFAGMQIEPKAMSVFSKNDEPRPSVYKVSIREISKSDVLAKLNYLKSIGFNFTEKNDTGKAALYKNSPKRQSFHYNPINGEYFYNNPQINGLTEKDRSDTNRLRFSADQCLKGFVGDDWKNFCFSNKEAQYLAINNGKDNIPFLYQLSFRYIRVLDGRQIKGVSNHIVIRLGQDCQIEQITMTDKKLEKMYDIGQKIKNSSMNKYLQDYVERNEYKKASDGSDIPIKGTLVKKACESYFAVGNGSTEYLRPHISFLVIDSMTDGNAAFRELHLPVDGAAASNNSKEEIIEYEKQLK